MFKLYFSSYMHTKYHRHKDRNEREQEHMDKQNEQEHMDKRTDARALVLIIFG